jgi:hypothetical protein
MPQFCLTSLLRISYRCLKLDTAEWASRPQKSATSCREVSMMDKDIWHPSRPTKIQPRSTQFPTESVGYDHRAVVYWS